MKKSNPKPKPPRHLKPETARWWANVLSEFELEPHHIRLLTLAAEAWDRYSEARAIIDKKGLIYEDRFGQPVVRPEVAIERDSRTAFARLLRELALDTEPPRASGRPPGLA